MSQTIGTMSFGEHLEDLRKRVFYAILGPLPIFIVCLVFGDELITFLTAPLLTALRSAGEAPHLINLSPVEPFAAYMKVALVATLILGMPWILYQLWLFVAPGLYAKERRFIYFLLPLSGLLTALGLAFLYYVLLPLSLVFLIEFGASLVRPVVNQVPLPEGIVLPSIPSIAGDPIGAKPGQMWINTQLEQVRIQSEGTRVLAMNLHSGAGVTQEYRLSEYIDLVFMLGLAFAVAFQLPIVLMLLSWVGLLKPALLVGYRKHALFGAVVLGALLPTQDPASLIMLTVVIYGLYELGVLLMRFMPASRVAGGWWRPASASEPAGAPPGRGDGEFGDE